MAILHKNITAAADIHNPKWFSGANSGDYAFKNEKGELESIDELLLPAALNFVDGSVAPPTTNSGDIYILSSGGSVNAGWGGVSLQDWVRYDGTAWNSITPQKSSLCYDKTADSLKFYNGSAWAALGGGSDTNFSNTDLTFDADRNHELDSNKYILRSKLVSNADRIESFYNNSPVGGMVQDHYDKFGTLIHCVNRDSFGAFAYAVGYFRSGMDVGPKSAIKMRGFSGTGSYIKFSNQFGDPYSQVGANMPHYFLAASGALATNKFIVGENSAVGSESISLQGHTLIKGTDTLSTSSALQVYDGDSTPNLLVDFKNSGNVDINANWRANEGTLKINSNNQSFVGMGLTDTTNGYYGGFFWRPTTQYLTIGSNTSGFAIEPTANNQDFVFTSSSFTSENELIVNDDFTLNGNQEVNANWVASKGTININSSNQSFNGFGLTDTATGYMGFFGYRPTNDYFVIESTSAISGISFNTNGNNRRMTITDNGLNISNLPTSSAGLSSGDVYNDSGTLKIV